MKGRICAGGFADIGDYDILVDDQGYSIKVLLPNKESRVYDMSFWCDTKYMQPRSEYEIKGIVREGQIKKALEDQGKKIFYIDVKEATK